jgi:protein disulfide-isomerase A6
MRCAFLLCSLLILHIASNGLAMYAATSNVISLTDRDFDSKVIKSDGIWLVEFYAPWCGHCQSLKPEYERLAGILKGLVNVAAVDADQFKSLGGRFGIQGFPTIKLFNIDKQKPEDYQGERNSGAMLEYDFRLPTFFGGLLFFLLVSSYPHMYLVAVTVRRL